MKMNQKSLGILFLAGLLIMSLSPAVFSQQNGQAKKAEESLGMRGQMAMTMPHGGQRMMHGAGMINRCPGSMGRMNMMSMGGTMMRMRSMSDQMESIMEDMSSIMSSKMMTSNELKNSLQQMNEQMEKIRDNMKNETDGIPCMSGTNHGVHKDKNDR